MRILPLTCSCHALTCPQRKKRIANTFMASTSTLLKELHHVFWPKNQDGLNVLSKNVPSDDRRISVLLFIMKKQHRVDPGATQGAVKVFATK